MADNHVHIITDCGPGMGTGHLQRMILLAWYLNRYGTSSASLQVRRPYENMPEEIVPFITGNIPPALDIIIRDMRNSTVDEIKNLQQHAPVLVIDDEGDGADVADERFFLLPRPGQATGENTLSPFFLYGYGLYAGMKGEAGPPARDIDLSLYTGNSEDHPYTEKILSLLPGNLTIALLNGDKSRVIAGDKTIAGGNPVTYTSLLLRSRCVMSHFGILLYEAHLCGCTLLSINPTGYHSHLADITALPVHNLGSIELLQNDSVAKQIGPFLSSRPAPPCSPSVILQHIHENLDAFYRRLTSLPFYR